LALLPRWWLDPGGFGDEWVLVVVVERDSATYVRGSVVWWSSCRALPSSPFFSFYSSSMPACLLPFCMWIPLFHQSVLVHELMMAINRKQLAQ
jgi:hypothetical protein